MIEAYPDVTCLDSLLALAADSGSAVTSAIRITGGAGMTNALEIDGTTGIVNVASTGNSAFVPNNKGTFTQCGQIKIKIGSSTYYIPFGTVA
jgi:hypothetical protein